MIKSTINWLSNFDSIKAIFMAIVTIIASWYDLKYQVKLTQDEVAIIRKDIQTKSIDSFNRDSALDVRMAQMETQYGAIIVMQSRIITIMQEDLQESKERNTYGRRK